MRDDRREGEVINPSHREIKRARNSIDGEEDFVSSLPDDIIHHIFSFLPTNFAIRTSILSQRWRHVWSKTPSLSIDLWRSNSDPNSVNETLTRYSCPKITSFDLCISSKAHQIIDSLIEFATSRNTEKLSLNFRDSYDHNLPDCFYTNSSLKQLLVESGTIDTIPSCITLSWTSLKTLSLRCCVLSDESFAKILSGSPLLESLTLRYCAKLERLDLSESVKCKRLDIEDCGPMQIVAPHIHCLRLEHSELQCCLVDVSSLTEAYVNIYCPREFRYLYDDFGDPETGLADSLQAMIVKALETLQNVEKITFLGAFFLQILSLADVCGVPFPTLKVEALTFEAVIDQSIIPGVAKLLQSSPRLKKLKLQIVDCNIIEVCCLTNYLYWKGLDTYQCWKPKDLVLSTLSESKLKSSFMKFLLKNSGDDCYTVGSYSFSQPNNYSLKDRDRKEMVK